MIHSVKSNFNRCISSRQSKIDAYIKGLYTKRTHQRAAIIKTLTHRAHCHWSVLTSSSAAFSVKTQAAKSYSTLELTTTNALTLKLRRLLKSSITSTTTTSQD